MDTAESSYTSDVVCPGCDQKIVVALGENGWASHCGGGMPGIGCEELHDDLHEKAMLEVMVALLIEEPEVENVDTDEVLAEFFELIGPSLRPYVLTLTERLIEERPHLRLGVALSMTLNWWFN